MTSNKNVSRILFRFFIIWGFIFPSTSHATPPASPVSDQLLDCAESQRSSAVPTQLPQGSVQEPSLERKRTISDMGGADSNSKDAKRSKDSENTSATLVLGPYQVTSARAAVQVEGTDLYRVLTTNLLTDDSRSALEVVGYLPAKDQHSLALAHSQLHALVVKYRMKIDPRKLQEKTWIQDGPPKESPELYRFNAAVWHGLGHLLFSLEWTDESFEGRGSASYFRVCKVVPKLAKVHLFLKKAFSDAFPETTSLVAGFFEYAVNRLCADGKMNPDMDLTLPRSLPAVAANEGAVRESELMVAAQFLHGREQCSYKQGPYYQQATDYTQATFVALPYRGMLARYLGIKGSVRAINKGYKAVSHRSYGIFENNCREMLSAEFYACKPHAFMTPINMYRAVTHCESVGDHSCRLHMLSNIFYSYRKAEKLFRTLPKQESYMFLRKALDIFHSTKGYTLVNKTRISNRSLLINAYNLLTNWYPYEMSLDDLERYAEIYREEGSAEPPFTNRSSKYAFLAKIIEFDEDVYGFEDMDPTEYVFEGGETNLTKLDDLLLSHAEHYSLTSTDVAPEAKFLKLVAYDLHREAGHVERARELAEELGIK